MRNNDLPEFVTSKTKRQNYFQNLRLSGGCASLEEPFT
jgi:hypothetical protein